MDELPPRAKAVLRRAQEHDQWGAQEARRRVREGVTKAVGASVFERPHAPTQSALPSASSAPLGGLAGKLGAATLLVALVGTGIALRHGTAESREPGVGRGSVVVSAPAAALPLVSSLARPRARFDAEAAERPELPPAPQVPQQAEPGEAPVRVGRRVRPLSSDTLDVEVALLRQLGEAVSRRDTREAARLLAKHQARFPQPVLLEERQGFQALVRCMDDSPGALSSSRAFAARYPNSVLTARVLRECEQAPVER